jgi:hypothetical protein
MEQPFALRFRKPNRWLLALLGAFWLSVGVASAMYLAQAPTIVDAAD